MPHLDVYIAPFGSGMNSRAVLLAREIRHSLELSVVVGSESFSLRKSLETASKSGATYALIVGEDEVRSGIFPIKDLIRGKQYRVPKSEIVKKLKNLITAAKRRQPKKLAYWQ